jgi:predicted MFS family arabinose efflux permease
LLPVLMYCSVVSAVVSVLGTPLIPTIATAQHVSLGAAQWLLTVTLLVGAVAAPVLGRLGDGSARRKVLLLTIAAVAAGEVVAAAAPTFGVLLAGRAVQGVGLAITPLGLAVARSHLPPARLAAGTALLAVAGPIGLGLGYPITGLIAAHFDYRSAFWFGALFTVLALVAAIVVVPPGSPASGRQPADIPGAVLLGGGVTCALLAIGQGVVWRWTSALVLSLFLFSAVLLAAWVFRELSCSDPLVDLRLLRHSSVATADATGFMIGVGLYSASALINRFIQTPKALGYGFSSSLTETGLLLAPIAIGSLVGSRITPRLLGWRRGYSGVILGSCLLAGDMIFLALKHDYVWQFVIGTTLVGLGVGTTLAALPPLIMRGTPPQRTSSALGFYQVLTVVGGSVGSAASVAVLSAFTPAGQRYPHEKGFVVAFVAAAACFLLAALTCLVVPALVRVRAPRARPAAGLSAQLPAVAGGVPAQDHSREAGPL